jgi:uncharacterized protein (DUF1778 family)
VVTGCLDIVRTVRYNLPEADEVVGNSMQAKAETLELRVSPALKDLVRRAAAAKGQSMTEFVLSIVEPVAADIVDQQQQIRLSQVAWEDFVRLTTAATPAKPLAKAEAAEFLSRFGRE